MPGRARWGGGSEELTREGEPLRRDRLHPEEHAGFSPRHRVSWGRGLQRAVPSALCRARTSEPAPEQLSGHRARSPGVTADAQGFELSSRLHVSHKVYHCCFFNVEEKKLQVRENRE